MTADELQARTEALDAELKALDDQVRKTAVVAYVLNRCALCKLPDRHMNAGYCAECVQNLNNH